MKNILWLMGLFIALLISNSVKAQEGGTIVALAMRPDGTSIAISITSWTCREHSDNVLLLSYPDLKMLSTLETNARCPIEELEWSTDGRYLIATEGIGRAYVWDTVTQQRISESESFSMGGQRYGDFFKPDTTLVATTSWGAGLILWDAVTGEVIEKYFDNQTMITAEWSPDGAYLVTSRDTETSRECLILESEHFTQLASLACDSWVVLWSPDGSQIITAETSTMSFSIWDAFTYELLYQWDKESPLTDWHWLPNSSHIAAALDEGLVIWDIRTGQRTFTYQTDVPIREFDISSVDGSIVYVRSDKEVDDPLSNLQIIPASSFPFLIPTPLSEK